MSKGTYRFKKPSTEHETGSLRLGLHLWEADEHSETPGAVCGNLQVLDHTQQVVFHRELKKEEVAPLTEWWKAIKAGALESLSVTFEPEPDPEFGQEKPTE